MRLTRIFVDIPLQVGARIALPEAAAAHLVRVLRLREGESCVLFNGDGHDHDARLLAANKRGVEAEVTGTRAIGNESPLRIVLLQGVARGEKMDLILQKATELGVTAIAPVFAERTEVRLDGERLGKRIAHWRSVMISACEQSGRARIPELLPARDLSQTAPAFAADALKLILDPAGEDRFDTLAAPGAEGVAIAIGPEGGWSEKDRACLREAGFTGLRLGPRVLRTETAGLAAIAAMQARFGDL
ncbi:MAG: 16S rRNA (uracil(1498)-N(3))-methyltransferase [Lysobacteraceae bacterium]|nr:MAG: 16S rRNA (uracil(1498)-N(3))-methyltransferase [Xanthomonadaceae bacterium]